MTEEAVTKLPKHLVTLTKLDYDQFVFPAVVSFAPSNMQQFEAARQALRALRDKDLAEPEELGIDTVKKAAFQGKFLAPSWTLREGEATFDFGTQDVADLVASCIQSWVTSGRLNLVAGEHAELLADRIYHGD